MQRSRLSNALEGSDVSLPGVFSTARMEIVPRLSIPWLVCSIELQSGRSCKAPCIPFLSLSASLQPSLCKTSILMSRDVRCNSHSLLIQEQQSSVLYILRVKAAWKSPCDLCSTLLPQQRSATSGSVGRYARPCLTHGFQADQECWALQGWYA